MRHTTKHLKNRRRLQKIEKQLKRQAKQRKKERRLAAKPSGG
jgi:hypothetical protein